MAIEPVLALSCAGGGAHGAYQVGVLKYIHEHFSDNGRSPFRIFTGASCGSLNTTFFAAQSYDAQKSSLWLEDLWLSFHVPQYHGNIVKNIFVALLKQWRMRHHLDTAGSALLDPMPMKNVLSKGFRRENLEHSLKEGSTLGVAIAATELVSGRTCWFQEGPHAHGWNTFHSLGLLDKIQADHMAASCSVPVFLPPVKIGDHYFLDGTVSLSKPLNAAILMGATKVLSIATDKPAPDSLPHYQNHFKPRLSSVIRLVLNQLSRDLTSPHPHETDPSSRYHHETEIFRLVPSKRIRSLTGIEDSSFHRKRTRFMFHASFIRELIDLGYEDAKARHTDLRSFFLSDSTMHRAA